MKLRLIDRAVCPPEGFRYVFPESGFVAHDWTYDAWVEHAGRHLQANNLPHPPELHAQMEDQLCQTLPPGWCRFDDPARPRPSTVLDWSALTSGLKTFGTWFASGMEIVDKAEAERRALICSRCYLNVQVSGCSGCQKLVAEVTGKHTTKYDFALRACGVCKCVLRAKVHFPQEILDREGEKLQEMYPEFCWLKKGGVNYRA